MLSKYREEKLEDGMMFSAFTFWLRGETKKTFVEYLRSLGIVKKPKKLDKETSKNLSDKALEKARRIIEGDRLR